MSYKNPIMREDPNAIDKLYEKLAECERLQDTMKEALLDFSDRDDE